MILQVVVALDGWLLGVAFKPDQFVFGNLGYFLDTLKKQYAAVCQVKTA